MRRGRGNDSSGKYVSLRGRPGNEFDGKVENAALSSRLDPSLHHPHAPERPVPPPAALFFGKFSVVSPEVSGSVLREALDEEWLMPPGRNLGARLLWGPKREILHCVPMNRDFVQDDSAGRGQEDRLESLSYEGLSGDGGAGDRRREDADACVRPVATAPAAAERCARERHNYCTARCGPR